MNKHAAEKVAQQAYAQGSQRALQELAFIKQAGLGPLKLRRDISTPLSALAAMFTGAGAGGYGAMKGLASTPVFSKGMQGLDDAWVNKVLLDPTSHTYISGVDDIRRLAEVGGGMSLATAGMLGAVGGGALGLQGAKKFLNRNAPIERYLDLGVAQIPLGKARI